MNISLENIMLSYHLKSSLKKFIALTFKKTGKDNLFIVLDNYEDYFEIITGTKCFIY